MRLSDREIDCILLHNAGYLAQKRLARGLKLNYPEAVALISAQVLEFIRDGRSLSEVEKDAKSLLGEKVLQSGVDRLLTEICVEGTFKDGVKTIRVVNPICNDYGNLELALSGSFLPIPNKELFDNAKSQVFEQIFEQTQTEDIQILEAEESTNKLKQNGSEIDVKMDTVSKEDVVRIEVDEIVYPGKIFIDYARTAIDINKDPEVTLLSVTNTSDEPISIGSHFNFIEANKLLKFDRTIAFGMRLNIPSGECITFTPKETVDVPLIKIGGGRIIKGGNNLVDGHVNEETLKYAMKFVRKRAFANEIESADLKASRLQIPFKAKIPKDVYVKKFGPTVGDRIVLGDTNLIIHIEKDYTVYGDELTFGIGKALREGMGQAANVRNDVALDTIITNVVIIDPMCGIIKADIGIRDGMIQGIGKGGNPHTMSNITPGMVIGAGTEVIQGEGLLVTAGAIDCALCLMSPQSITECLSVGVTTVFGGGNGSPSASSMSTCGPNHIKYMIQSTDELPLNFGFYAKGNTSKLDGIAKELEDQLVAGAIGFRVNEKWGATTAAIDACLKAADFHDTSAIIDMDSMHESYNPSDIQSIYKNRFAAIPISETFTNRTSLIETLKQVNLVLMSCSANNYITNQASEGVSIEDYLHDIGAISIISSTNQSCGGQLGRVVTKTWQIASKMKSKRGRLIEEKSTDILSDNTRVKRYLSKYTINPAIFNGVSHAVGSIEPNKMADLVFWKPAFFGVKPEMVVKGGQITWSQNGLNGEPIKLRQQFGSIGKSPSANSVLFISKASFEVGATNTYGISKHVEPIKDCRNLTRHNMFFNGICPKLYFDTQENRLAIDINGRKENPIDSNTIQNECLPLSQRYFLF